MERREIFSSSNPGRAQWAELTRWSLTRVPLSDRAMLYKWTSAEAVEFTATVDGLPADVLKKLNPSHQGQVSLDPPQRLRPHKKVRDIPPCLVRHSTN